MVERLKKAIEKARAERERVMALADAAPSQDSKPTADRAARVAEDGSDPWSLLEEFKLDAAHLDRMRVVSYLKSNPAHIAFDVLRTRLLRVLKQNGWSRLAITSPTKGCGKTVISANLALSLARHPELRTMLIDMDLKLPGIAEIIGLTEPMSIESFLSGQVGAHDYLRRVGTNLALALSTERIGNSAELIQSERSREVLTRTQQYYKPDVVIYDLPPMLVSDDVLGFLPQVDCVLLIAAAGQSKPAEIEECERLLGDSTNFLGILLNKCKTTQADAYSYGYID